MREILSSRIRTKSGGACSIGTRKGVSGSGSPRDRNGVENGGRKDATFLRPPWLPKDTKSGIFNIFIKGFIKGFEERHYHDKPPSAPAEEGNIDMMRLLGVRPIDIISTTIMTTTLNGSLPASSDCIAPSQPPALCRYWPPAAPAAAARRGEI